MSIRPSWSPVVGFGVLDAAARVHRRAGRVRAAGYGRAVDEPVRVRGDRRERRAPARRHVGGVQAVRAVLAEVVLHRRCEAAHADRGDDPRDAAHVDELEPGDVLPLGRETVRRARPRPVDAAVVGDEEAFLRARGDFVTRVRVDAHLADCVVLRELARAARCRPSRRRPPRADPRSRRRWST